MCVETCSAVVAYLYVSLAGGDDAQAAGWATHQTQENIKHTFHYHNFKKQEILAKLHFFLIQFCGNLVLVSTT